MKAALLKTSIPELRLVEPRIERDAPKGLDWLKGDKGRETLRLMGVADERIRPTTLEDEKERIKDFITKTNQLNWMIEYKGDVIGTIWVDLEPRDSMASPSLHIMIGNPDMRGKGIGKASINAVLDFLKSKGGKNVYSRYVITNKISAELLSKLGFKTSGEPYQVGELIFQNIELEL